MSDIPEMTDKEFGDLKNRLENAYDFFDKLQSQYKSQTGRRWEKPIRLAPRKPSVVDTVNMQHHQPRVSQPAELLGESPYDELIGSCQDMLASKEKALEACRNGREFDRDWFEAYLNAQHAIADIDMEVLVTIENYFDNFDDID